VCIKAKMQSAREQVYQLHLQSDRERIIEIHSSNNKVAFTPNSKERNLQILKKDMHTLVDIGVKSS